MDEFSSAMMTAVKQGDGYILPVLMGNTPFRSTCCIRTFTTCARRTIARSPGGRAGAQDWQCPRCRTGSHSRW